VTWSSASRSSHGAIAARPEANGLPALSSRIGDAALEAMARRILAARILIAFVERQGFLRVCRAWRSSEPLDRAVDGSGDWRHGCTRGEGGAFFRWSCAQPLVIDEIDGVMRPTNLRCSRTSAPRCPRSSAAGRKAARHRSVWARASSRPRPAPPKRAERSHADLDDGEDVKLSSDGCRQWPRPHGSSESARAHAV